MDINKYKYLVKALRAYREISYGQFDQKYSSEVQETQDAANAIEELIAHIQELEKRGKHEEKHQEQ